MAYDFEEIKSMHAYVEAELNGWYIKVPAANELFIDIDDEQGENWYRNNYSKIETHIGIVDVKDTPSPSGTEGRKHIVVKLSRDVTPMERILLQAILGSDLRREALSWVRLVNNDPEPTLLYEKKPLQLVANEPLQLTGERA